MKTRIKKTLHQLPTREAAETCMNELALCVNNQRKLNARRDAQVLVINQQYESPLAELDEAIKEKTDLLQNWAETNPDQFPKDRKSIEMVSGILGFRTGTLKVALVSRAWTIDKVLEKLKAVARYFIRIKYEVDKDLIIAEYSAAADKTILSDTLKNCGLRVTQDETFYIEPKLTEQETRQTTAAA